MRPIRALIALAAAAFALAPVPAFAQAVTSAGPDSVSVTIYRAPDRGPDEALNLSWLEGYALISEQRTISIPAGRSAVRFEGVAGGILPESAIVTGLPQGVREKNLDADLLSPRSLYARNFGRPVTIRRTLGAGVVEERAVIRSGPDGAAILQTQDGFIAANCGPSRDALIYDSVPTGLSARPTLSVELESPEASQVTVTLSYLAWGFDWQANYVATMRPDGRSADLFAWVTLANSDVTSFADAETMVVAGRLNREDENRDTSIVPSGGPLRFSCFANMVYVAEDGEALQGQSMEGFALPAPVQMRAMVSDDEVIVTASRMVRQEELGDLKLYRVPDRTTVAAMSQKQVGLLNRTGVPVDVLYRVRLDRDDVGDPMLVLRAQNREDRGLGLPLPAGQVALFEARGGDRLLIGEGSTRDLAVNEEVEIEFEAATQVDAELDESPVGAGVDDYVLTVTNANPFAVRFEADFQVGEGVRRSRTSARLRRKNGRDLWAVEVPANGAVTLRYRLAEIED